MLKNHNSFSIKLGIHRDISVQIRSISTHFRPVKFWSRDRPPPKLGLHKPFISTFIAYKFQRCTGARSQEFAMGGCFRGWKQHQTIWTQILFGLQSNRVAFYVQIQVISKKKKVFSQAKTYYSGGNHIMSLANSHHQCQLGVF